MVLETAGVGSAGLLQLVGSGVAGCMGARPDQARRSEIKMPLSTGVLPARQRSIVGGAGVIAPVAPAAQ